MNYFRIRPNRGQNSLTQASVLAYNRYFVEFLLSAIYVFFCSPLIGGVIVFFATFQVTMLALLLAPIITVLNESVGATTGMYCLKRIAPPTPDAGLAWSLQHCGSGVIRLGYAILGPFNVLDWRTSPTNALQCVCLVWAYAMAYRVVAIGNEVSLRWYFRNSSNCIAYCKGLLQRVHGQLGVSQQSEGPDSKPVQSHAMSYDARGFPGCYYSHDVSLWSATVALWFLKKAYEFEQWFCAGETAVEHSMSPLSQILNALKLSAILLGQFAVAMLAGAVRYAIMSGWLQMAWFLLDLLGHRVFFDFESMDALYELSQKQYSMLNWRNRMEPATGSEPVSLCDAMNPDEHTQ